MIMNENKKSSTDYINDYYQKFYKIDDYDSDNFYSGIRNYRVTNHGTGKYMIIIGKGGNDPKISKLIRQYDKENRDGYYNEYQIKKILKEMATQLWNIRNKENN